MLQLPGVGWARSAGARPRIDPHPRYGEAVPETLRRRLLAARSMAAPRAGAAIVLLMTTACTPVVGSTASSAAPTTLAASGHNPTPIESLLTERPDPHSSAGRLADRFPVGIIPVADGAEVLVSSAAPAVSAGLWDVSLNLRTGQDAAGLVDAYRKHLLAAGFVESAPGHVEPGLAAQAAFSRSNGAEVIVIGILDRDGMRTMTLGGRVRIGS